MTENERNMDEILKNQSPLASASDEDLRLSQERIVQRLADAMKVQGMEDRTLSRSLGLTRPLADFEQRVLNATLELGGGEVPTVTDKVNERLTPSSGTTAVLFTLNLLEGEDLVTSFLSQSGRSYKVTEDGERALAAAKAQAEAGDREAINPLGDFA